MQVHPKTFVRFLSDPYGRNFGFLREDNKDNKSILRQIEDDHPLQEKIQRRSSSKAEQEIDDSEKKPQRVSEIFQRPTIAPVASVLANETKNKDMIISTPPPCTLVETGLTFHRDIKPGSQRFRWNLLFNLLLWIIVPFPLWIPFISNRIAYYTIPSIQALFVSMWTIIALLALKNALILYVNRYHDFSRNYATSEKIRIRHIVAISCYKEPVELIAKSIQTLADQTEVRRITMVVSFEERTPNREEKCQFLKNQFGKCGFENIIFTVHPFGVPNEIPGKCSNSNYGLRTSIQQMAIADNETDNILVTTCDADSKFPSQYIAALTHKYLKENRPALTTIYQPPLFYNWKLDGLSFVTRVTGLLRSLLMLGALIPFSINTMSIFSFSLSLAKKGNYVHPAYQMDDIICLIRWMGVTQRRLRISMVPVPVLSGPTSGETVEKEIIEWVRQARRWTIGAAEVFHYFVIKARKMPPIAACSWGICFIIYYGVLLCTGGLYGITSMLSMFLLVKDTPLVISYVMYGLLALQMFTFLIAFIIDIFIPKLLHVEECIFILRNLFHFLSTPFVLLAYSFVELYALHEIIIFGKKVCKHGASEKTVL